MRGGCFRWETALTTRDTNRIVRPLEWGFDWLADFARPRGLMPEPAIHQAPKMREPALLAINNAVLRDREAFYGYTRPTDFRLEERHPKLFPTNVRPETLRRDAQLAPSRPRSRMPRRTSSLHSPDRTPYPENDLVNARWYPAPPEKQGASQSRPSSSCRSGMPTPSATTRCAGSSIALASPHCASPSPITISAALGAGALRLRRQRQLGRTLSATAARLSSIFAAASTGLKNRVTSQFGVLGTSLGSCYAF